MIVLKILLFILLAILGIIILVLITPVIGQVSFIGKKLSYKVKFGLIPLLDSEGGGLVGRLMSKDSGNEKTNDKSDETEKAENTADESDNKSESEEDKSDANQTESDNPTEKAEETVSEEEATDKKEIKSAKGKKKSVSELLDLVTGIWNSAKRPLRKILKGFHFTDIYIDFLIANEDAYKCALNYGRISGSVYNLLGVMGTLFTLKYKSVDIESGFAQSESRWDVGCKLKFVPMTAVIAGIWFLVTYIFRVYLPEKRAKKKMMKTAEEQNTQPQGGM